MEAKDFTIRKTPCSSPLPELEVPMINTMVACLGVEPVAAVRRWRTARVKNAERFANDHNVPLLLLTADRGLVGKDDRLLPGEFGPPPRLYLLPSTARASVYKYRVVSAWCGCLPGR